MEKWNRDIYKNNNMKLMVYHIIFSVLSFLAGLIILALEKNIYGYVLLGWSVIHALLAFGTFNKFELSRKVSEFIFGIWALAFPIGTFLSIYLILPATQWTKPED